MGTRTFIRVEVLCSMCGPSCWANGKGEWTTVEAAYAELATEGWLIEEDRQLCPRCARSDDCAQEGHDFGDWIAARESCAEWRWCHHCTEVEIQSTEARTPAPTDRNVRSSLAREVDRG